MSNLVCIDVIGVSRLLCDAISVRLREVGVAIGQLPALLALYECDGLTQTELARATGVEQPTMAEALQRMERDGLISRVKDPDDGRRSRVNLTSKALSIQQTVQTLRCEVDEIALTGIAVPDRDALKRLLHQMAGNLSEHIG